MGDHMREQKQPDNTAPQNADALEFANLEELEPRAKLKLTRNAYGYYASGANSEATLAENRRVFDRYRVLPRMMRDVSRVDTTLTLLGERHSTLVMAAHPAMQAMAEQGKRYSTPILAAPMAMQAMAHPDGELATVRACDSAGVCMGVSTMGTYSLEDVARESADPGRLMFQLYVLKDRDFTRDIVQRAERAGYGALAVTVDAPRLGKREVDVTNKFLLPDGLRLANLDGSGLKLPIHAEHQSGGSGIAQVFAQQIDASVTWEFVGWLRSVTRLPILVKGVLAPLDAQLAVQAGVDGIILSNHGGRQCDCAPSAVEMLPHVVDAISHQVPLLVDGGIRRGTDVLKALALGADAVLLGRPILWGLTLAGQQGVEAVLKALHAELELAMQLCGCASLAQVTRSLVIGPDGMSLAQLGRSKL